jgi:membrane-associated protease RseP (regulator of RpoE activity)
MPTKKTQAAAASAAAETAKPARNRKAAEPEPVVEPAAEKPDRTMWWALVVLAAAVVFGGGYLVGHAVADDDGEFGPQGRGRIVVSGPGTEDYPMGPGHHLPGMIPFEMYPMPGMDQAPDQADDGASEGEGYLGIRGVDTPGAVLILEVEAGSPADDAGIAANDRVISFGGTAIESMEQLAALVRRTEPGTEVDMVLGGPGGRHAVTVVVGERPEGE